MTDAPRLDLLRPRNIGELLGDAFNTYVRHFRAFISIGVAVVVPVELIVSGLGLGELGGDYANATGTAASTVEIAQGYLLITPLVTAMVVHALLAAADGRHPHPGQSIIGGLEAFRPIFGAVVIAAVGILLGFIAFLIPGIWLLVRWCCTAQAVVVDNRRGIAALNRSAELVSGSWWRVAGILIFIALCAELSTAIIVLPLSAAAHSSDSGSLFLLGQIIGGALATPFAALMLTLLYFDLLARRSLPAMVPPVQPPE